MTKLVSRSSLATSLVLAISLALSGCGGGGGGRANVTPGVMPASQSFTGVYHSPQYGEMQVVQTGNQVVGEYVQDERRGQIQGTITGDLMRFEWSERRELVQGRPNLTRGRGYFRFVAHEDGDFYLIGEWGHDQNETGGGPWRAVRDRRRRPSLSTDSHGTTTGGATEEENQGDSLDAPGGSGSSSSNDLGDL
jgi:hypothetical protein